MNNIDVSTINNNELFEKAKKDISKEANDSMNLISLRADIFKKGEKLRATFRTDTSMFYGAWIQILGDMEKKYQAILQSYGLTNTVKNLWLDGKASVDKAKNAFEVKAQEFRKTIDADRWFWLFSNNDKMVTEIAQSIMNIKTTFMVQLLKEYNKEIVVEEKKVKETIKESQEKQGAIIDDTFTKVTNPLPIQEVVSMSKFGKVDRLVLDYSWCTNSKIREKAISYSADKKSPQIVIERKTINGIDTFVYEWTEQRALVWEWIKMLPAVTQTAAKKWQEYQKKKKNEMDETKRQQLGVYENYKALWIHLKNWLHINWTEITEAQERDISMKLYEFIESELTRLIWWALNGTSVPENPEAPFAGAMTSWKLLVFEAISGQANQYILRESELESMFGSDIWDEIYDLLDESENEAKLKSFLNARWKVLYQERVTKNKNFVIDAKVIEKNGKMYTTNGEWKLQEITLEDNQVYVEWLDIDWKTPQNAVWVQNQINTEMNKIIQEIKNGTITMPENAEPFGTNRLFLTKDEEGNFGHYIEFDQENGVVDRNLFDFSLFIWKKDIQNIFSKNDNTYKIVQYMNKIRKEKYTDLVRSKKNIKEISKIEDPKELSTQIGVYLDEIIKTYKDNNEVDEEQKAEQRIKIREVSLWLQSLSKMQNAMPEGEAKNALQKTIQKYSATLAEITSGTGGKNTGITDADELENALLESEAEENMEIATQNIDAELVGKSLDELITFYVEKHDIIDSNYSQIDGFEQNAPAYMHALGKKIFEKIKGEKTTATFTLENKREKMFELAQIARDESDLVNIDNDFIDYDLSEEIFVELFSGEGGILDKVDSQKAIKPEHKESAGMSIDERKQMFNRFPGGEQIAAQDWVNKPYKDLKIEERTMLATYKNYEDRFWQIDKENLKDPTYVNLVAQQIVEATQLSAEFMMRDYQQRLENNLRRWEVAYTKYLFPWLSDFDNKIAEAYIDMKWLGAFDISDKNAQTVKEVTPMIATIIVAVVATIVTWWAAWPALAAAIGNAAATIGVAVSEAAATMLASALIWWLVGSAVMIWSEFIQWKAYENFNEGFIDVTTMTATFVGTSLITMWIGNYLNKIPSWLAKIYKASAMWQRMVASKLLHAGITAIETAGSGALMWYVENQRQKWLTGESHPEMVIQMMWLAMWMRIAFSAFGTGKSLAEKWVKEGKGEQLSNQNQKLINELESGLKDPKTEPEAKSEIQKQLNEAKDNQQKINWNMNTKNQMSETQIREEISKIDREIEKIMSGDRNDPYRIESNEVLQNRIDNLKKIQHKGQKYKYQLDMAEQVLNERNVEISALQDKKLQLESQLPKNQAKAPQVESEGKVKENLQSSQQKEANPGPDTKNKVKTKPQQQTQTEIKNQTVDGKVNWEQGFEIVEMPKDAVEVDAKAYDIANNRQSYYDNYANKPEYESIGKQYQENYGNVSELQRIDTELAEQLILDGWKPLEYSKTEYLGWKTAEQRCKESYQELNKLPKYKDQLKVSTDGNGKYFIEKMEPIKDQKWITWWTGEKLITEWTEQRLITGWIDQWLITEGKLPEQLTGREILKQVEAGKTKLLLPPHIEETMRAFPESKFPYRLLPIFFLPLEDKRSGVLYNLTNNLDAMIKNPRESGVELDAGVTWPYDTKKIATDNEVVWNEIDAMFNQLLKENKINFPLQENTLITLRGVSSRTHAGPNNATVYNEALAETRANECKKYLMEKYPVLTDANFIIWSFHKADEVVDTDPKKFQWVTMSVINMGTYWGIPTLPTWPDWRVIPN